MKIAQSEKAGARGGAPWGGHVRLTLEESLETVTSHERGSAAGRAGEGTFQASLHCFVQRLLIE